MRLSWFLKCRNSPLCKMKSSYFKLKFSMLRFSLLTLTERGKLLILAVCTCMVRRRFYKLFWFISRFFYGHWFYLKLQLANFQYIYSLPALCFRWSWLFNHHKFTCLQLRTVKSNFWLLCPSGHLNFKRQEKNSVSNFVLVKSNSIVLCMCYFQIYSCKVM